MTIDFIAGNWGLNSRFTASSSQPITLYASDFEDNGTIDPVITYYYKDRETAFASFDELTKQMPFLKKKTLVTSAMPNARFQSLFPSKKIDGAIKKEVNELAPCYFENQGDGTFKKHILPIQAQFSPIFDLKTTDLNNDGFPDVLMVGNNYEISTQLGRLDALRDNILINNKNGGFMATITKPPFWALPDL